MRWDAVRFWGVAVVVVATVSCLGYSVLTWAIHDRNVVQCETHAERVGVTFDQCMELQRK